MTRFNGITEKQKKSSMVLNTLMLIIGAVFAILSFTLEGRRGSMFSPAQDLPDELRIFLLLGGIFIFVDGISNFISVKRIDESYVDIGSDRVSGCQYSSMFFVPREESFDLTYEQIARAEVSNPSAMTPTLTIYTSHNTYKVCLADAQKAANLINTRINRS